MAKQNIYDNDRFFENFKSIRENSINFNELLETPILNRMMPNIKNKTVLDIGCGMGHHAKQYADAGATYVLGIDLSENMLAYAREHYSAKNIEYRQMAMEDMNQITQKFDVVTSSLVFDYVEDFYDMMKKVRSCLKNDGVFVFSMSHPIDTAYDGTYERYTRSEENERLYANVRNYGIEGKRVIHWEVDDYELYHHTFSTIVNAMIKAGLQIEECQESTATQELLNKYPGIFEGTLHQPNFIFFRCTCA